MNHHAGWQMRSILARVENTELLDQEELETLQTEFITKSNYNLNTEAGNTLLKGFNFDSMEEFITYYNAYENKKLALHKKFPQLKNELFLKIQKQYIAELHYSDITLEIVNTRDDIPGQVLSSVPLKKCTYNTDDCPNFEANGCHVLFKQCVLDKQLDWIERLMNCWGEEFIYVDFNLAQECQYNFLGELVCFDNPPNVGGIGGVVYILVGGEDIDLGGGISCINLTIDFYDVEVCRPCQNNLECDCG